MKRAVRFALVAVLCWLGLAQAYITWGPRAYVPTEQTHQAVPVGSCGNNAWSVTGEGGPRNLKVDVAYVASCSDGKESVWFAGSTDGGMSWADTLPLSDPYADSSGEPCLVHLDFYDQNLAAAWISWYHKDMAPDPDTVYARVWCNGLPPL